MLPRPCLHGRAPRELARSVRGGFWNNNQDNARADYRNNNHPNNRNNNYGFRVVLVSHILIDCPLPPDSADYGLRDAGVGRWMARVRPVHTGLRVRLGA